MHITSSTRRVNNGSMSFKNEQLRENVQDGSRELSKLSVLLAMIGQKDGEQISGIMMIYTV